VSIQRARPSVNKGCFYLQMFFFHSIFFRVSDVI